MKWNHTKFNSIITIIIAVLTLFLLINQINGSPLATTVVEVLETSSSLDDLQHFATSDNADDTEAETTTTTTPIPYVRGRGRNKQIPRKHREEEPPEKTWKALQICGIITFFVIILYYIKKITKKFERNHEDDHL